MKPRILLALALVFACSSPAPRRLPPPPPVPADAPASTATTPSAPSDAASAPEPSSRKPLPVQIDAALAKRIDAAIDKALAANTMVGATVVVARDGVVVYQRAAGYADRESKRPVREDTMFRFASMTKPIVSAAALALVDQGKLSLDDPVTKYIPEFRPRLADGREPRITVRHLITHMSGLTYKFIERPGGPYHQADVSDGLAEPAMTMKENLKRLASVPLTAAPGTKWQYSLSVDVLGEVMARAAGDELPSLVAHLVTRPIGMTDTTFAVTERDRLAWPYGEGKPPTRMADPHDMTIDGHAVRFSPSRIFDSASFASGGAGLAGTARDYLAFAEELRTGASRILRPETARAMLSNQVGSERSARGRGFGYGVGVWVDPAANKNKAFLGVGSFGWGGIYGTNFWVDPVAKLSVVYLSNDAGDSLLFNDIEKAIYEP